MIHGKQVFLRGLEREDLDLLHKWLNDEEVMRWARSKPDHVATAESLDKEYEQELKGESTRRRTFIIVENQTQKPIGWGGIRWWRPFHTTADIGLAIGEKEFRSRGIGTEVTRLLVELAFEQHNMHKAELWTLAENTAAIGAATKNGFKEEGRFRESVYFDGKFHDALMFGLLRQEYEKSKTATK